jgi:RND family efflux transporter MFP subunit
MKPIHTLFLIAFIFILPACRSNSENSNRSLADKQQRLAELKQQQKKLNEQIASLQEEILRINPSLQQEEPKLVAWQPVQVSRFVHYIDLQGNVEAENIAYVMPRNGTGGQVKEIYVRQGDAVKKGQVLLKLDDAIIQQQIQNAQIQLNFLKDVYQRKANLWKENIGTEVDLNNAKTNVEQAQKQLDILKEQLSFTRVTADMNGIAEEVTIKKGEFFTGNPAAGHIKIVNTNNLKVVAHVPENYLPQVKEGSHVVVHFPDIGTTVSATVSLTGKIINPDNRSFYIEIKLPYNAQLKSNQIALVNIQDYEAPQALVVPVNTLQTDEQGKFVLVAKQENNKLVARKKTVIPGMMYDNLLEIKNGLQPGDSLITEGYQGLYDGQPITATAP